MSPLPQAPLPQRKVVKKMYDSEFFSHLNRSNFTQFVKVIMWFFYQSVLLINQLRWKLFQTNRKKNPCRFNDHVIAIVIYSLSWNGNCSHLVYFWKGLHTVIHVYVISSKPLRFLYKLGSKQFGFAVSSNALWNLSLVKFWHIEGTAFTFATYVMNVLFFIAPKFNLYSSEMKTIILRWFLDQQIFTYRWERKVVWQTIWKLYFYLFWEYFVSKRHRLKQNCYFVLFCPNNTNGTAWIGLSFRWK